jgi:hypothetical protein
MLKWSVVCRPREFGGLGIINTQILNECLMVKWIWKLYQQKESLWVKLIKGKYMRDDDFYGTRGTQGFQLWKKLHRVKHLFKWGAVHKVGNGRLTKFWDDVWMTSSPLRVCFPKLYDVCGDKGISVKEVANRGWQIEFRRMLREEEYNDLIRLENMVPGIQLTTDDDVVSWGLTKSKKLLLGHYISF